MAQMLRARGKEASQRASASRFCRGPFWKPGFPLLQSAAQGGCSGNITRLEATWIPKNVGHNGILDCFSRYWAIMLHRWTSPIAYFQGLGCRSGTSLTLPQLRKTIVLIDIYIYIYMCVYVYLSSLSLSLLSSLQLNSLTATQESKNSNSKEVGIGGAGERSLLYSVFSYH